MAGAAGVLRGRGDVLRALEEWLVHVRDGVSEPVHLEGVPGVGKTAVLRWLDQRAGVDGMRTLWVTGHPLETEIAWAGLSQLVAPHLQRLDQLDVRPRETLLRTMRLGDRGQVDHVSVGMSLLLLLTATDQPTVVIVDDLQWVDTTTVDVLRFVGRRLHATGVGIISAGHPGSDGTAEASGVRLIPVDALGVEELRAVARDVGAVDAVARTVADHAAGLPLVVRQIVEDLSIGQLSGAEPLTEPLSAIGRADESLVRRLSALPANARRLLAAAALAPTLDPRMLARVTGIALLPAEAAHLATLTEAGLLFAHPSVRTAAIRALSDDERRALHIELADVSGVEHAGWHLAAATTGPDDVAAASLDALAADAENRGAHLVALRARQTAIRIAATPDPERELAAARAAVAARLSQVAVELLDSESLVSRRDTPAVIGVRAEAAWIAGDVGTARRLWAQIADDPAAPHDIAIACRRHAAMAAFRMYDTPGALEMTAGGDADDPVLRMIGLGASALAGRSGAVEELVEIARVQVESSPDSATTEALAQVVTLALARTGRLDDLAALSERVTERAAEDAALVVPALLIARAASTSRRDLSGAIALARQAMALAEEWQLHEHRPFAIAIASICEASTDGPDTAELVAQIRAYGVPVAQAVAQYAEGLVHYGREQYAEASATLLPLHDAHPQESGFGFLWHADLVDVSLQLGDHDTARRVADDLRAINEGTESPWVRASVCRVEALLADDRDQANLRFAEGVELFEAHGYVISGARLRLEWAQRLRRDRRRAAARERIRGVAEVLATAGSRRWAERAQREEVALGVVSEERSALAASILTARELQVARWLVAGLTYKQIGGRLFMSARTAEAHGQAVYRKLGIHRRAELARLAHDDRTLGDPLA